MALLFIIIHYFLNMKNPTACVRVMITMILKLKCTVLRVMHIFSLRIAAEGPEIMLIQK